MTRLERTIPALPVAETAAAVDFYRGRLGFDVVHQEDGYAIVRRGDAELHLWHAGDTSWHDRSEWSRPIVSGAESFIAGTASCRIEVRGIDDLFDACREHRVLHPVAKAVEPQPWGTREFSVLDGDGNLLTFFER